MEIRTKKFFSPIHGWFHFSRISVVFYKRILLLMAILLAMFSSLSCSKDVLYDGFRNCDRILTSDKKEYSLGDIITLTFTLKARRPQLIRLRNDLWESIKLSIRKYSNGKPDPADKSYPSSDRETSGEESIGYEEIFLSRGEEISKSITGIVKSDVNKGQYVFDFGNFGIFEKNRLGEFGIWLHFFPWKPLPDNSLESFSNKIFIKVVPPTAGPQ